MRNHERLEVFNGGLPSVYEVTCYLLAIVLVPSCFMLACDGLQKSTPTLIFREARFLEDLFWKPKNRSGSQFLKLLGKKVWQPIFWASAEAQFLSFSIFVCVLETMLATSFLGSRFALIDSSLEMPVVSSKKKTNTSANGPVPEQVQVNHSSSVAKSYFTEMNESQWVGTPEEVGERHWQFLKAWFGNGKLKKDLEKKVLPKPFPQSSAGTPSLPK